MLFRADSVEQEAWVYSTVGESCECDEWFLYMEELHGYATLLHLIFQPVGHFYSIPFPVFPAFPKLDRLHFEKPAVSIYCSENKTKKISVNFSVKIDPHLQTFH
jgi:hypothetical protein